MPFPFTFRFSVPGLPNPFAARPTTSAEPCSAYVPDEISSSERYVKVHRRPLSPAPSSSLKAPLSRKRGWVPSFAEPTQSTTSLSSHTASGYLDTPAKYKDIALSMANTERNECNEHDDMAKAADLDLPPAKRRRGLGGSIVTTALSAALIGTAVGLTVYRLWRDRGKQPEPERLAPPPPYQQGEWVPVQQAPTMEVTPPTPSPRRPRPPLASSSAKRSVARRRTRARPIAYTPPRDMYSPKRHHFDFNVPDHDNDDEGGGGAVEDQMDWIGDKLSMLIAEGKKALGKEVVVMSDAPEDQVDDGSGAWEEEEEDSRLARPSSRAGSISRRRLAPSCAGSPPSSYSMPSSPRKRTFAESPSPSYIPVSTSFPPPSHAPERNLGIPSDPGGGTGDDCQSPELREYMEKARARYRNRQ